MKKLLLITAASFSLIASTSILAKNQKVTICPGVSAIQSVNFDMAYEVSDQQWRAGIANNNFDTNVAWKFIIKDISAKDSNTAIKIGSEAVKSLRFVVGPTHARIECSDKGYCDVAICEYTNQYGYESLALNAQPI